MAKVINLEDASCGGERMYECKSLKNTLRLKIGEVITEAQLTDLIGTGAYEINIRAKKEKKDD